MRAVLVVILASSVVPGDDSRPNQLSPEEIAEGWLLLFDGETTFGWMTTGDVKAADGKLLVKGQAQIPLLPPGILKVSGNDTPHKKADFIHFANQSGQTDSFQNIKYKPDNMKPIFDGKSLNGWKIFEGDAKRKASRFEITPAGELHVLNGPGDLQTEQRYENFLLQLDCKTNGKGLNSGIFFRCRPNEYQQGYEAQIQNLFNNNDRTRPTDFGTGAIYRRCPARRVVSDDNKWFTMTIVAHGDRLRTWVNGYPVVDWVDDRKQADNARNGKFLQAGHISIQGHDPTTDILFRNIRIVEIK